MWALLVGLLLLPALAGPGRDRTDMTNRHAWLGVLAGLALSWWLWPGHPWVAGLLAWTVFGVAWVHPPSQSLIWMGWPMLAVAGAYTALVQTVTAQWVLPVCAVMVGVGLLQSAWVVYGVCQRHHGDPRFRHRLTWRGWYRFVDLDPQPGAVIPWGFFDVFQTQKIDRPTGGMGNPNHLDALMTMAVAADLGLFLLGWRITALIALCGLAMPFLIHRKITQGHLVLAVVLVALLALWTPWLAGGLVVLGLVVLVGVTWRRGWGWWTRYDNARLKMWQEAVRAWWSLGWPTRLCGIGAGQWLALAKHFPQQSVSGGTQGLYTHAHNEYVQHLIEYGLIGLTVLLAFLGTTFWTLAWAGTPESQAVLLLGVATCASAGINFPWSFLQQYQSPDRAIESPWPREYLDVTVGRDEMQRWVSALTGQTTFAWQQVCDDTQRTIQLQCQAGESQLILKPVRGTTQTVWWSGQLIPGPVLARRMTAMYMPCFVGNPALVAWSLVIAVLASIWGS